MGNSTFTRNLRLAASAAGNNFAQHFLLDSRLPRASMTTETCCPVAYILQIVLVDGGFQSIVGEGPRR